MGKLETIGGWMTVIGVLGLLCLMDYGIFQGGGLIALLIAVFIEMIIIGGSLVMSD